jgi:hypothetical protein
VVEIWSGGILWFYFPLLHYYVDHINDCPNKNAQMRYSYLIIINLFFVIIVFHSSSYSQELLSADGPGNTYELIRSKGLKLEVPDCVHPVDHVSEVWDDQLKEYVFAFDSHINLDNDRCRNFDRTRTELTVTDSTPPSYLGAHDGDAFTYTWKFKLDSNYLANSSFCHIHQIKAVGGDDGAPIITLTTRAGSPDKLQLIFTPSKGGSGGGVIKDADFTQFKGVWISVIEEITYNDHGKYSIILKRYSDGDTLFSYSNDNIDMSRTGANFYRPKIGIYRSLKNKSVIRDETVSFADFCIAKGTKACAGSGGHEIPPNAPTKVGAAAISSSQINIQWYDNSYNEDHFRIERSLNGTDWSLAALVTPSWERWLPQTLILNYIDTSLSAGTKYYYRIRAENLFGNSGYSDIVNTSTSVGTGINSSDNIPDKFSLQSSPNPFNPSTRIIYQIPASANVQIVIYDSLGRKIATLVNEFKSAGKYDYELNADDISGKSLTSGTYFIRMLAGNYGRVLKLSLSK